MDCHRSIAFSFGNLKESLLYFDYVLPSNGFGQIYGVLPTGFDQQKGIQKILQIMKLNYKQGRSLSRKMAKENLTFVFPPHLDKDDSLYFSLLILSSKTIAYLVKNYGDKSIPALSASKREINLLRKDVISTFHRIVKLHSLEEAHIDCPAIIFPATEKKSFDRSICLSGISLIDVEKVSVEHIMEFRKDKLTMKRMRDFRLFAYQNYTGKPCSFVEDDIQKKIDDYQRAVKSWGFETGIQSFEYLLDSRTLGGALVGTLLSVLMGHPSIAPLSLGTGVLIESGKFSLSLVKRKHGLSDLKFNNPISYIVDARKALNSPQ